MNYPAFFDQIESIELQDNLAHFLGSTDKGIIEFNYIDIVKAAGHSCPTVLGAYLITLKGLKALYKASCQSVVKYTFSLKSIVSKALPVL